MNKTKITYLVIGLLMGIAGTLYTTYVFQSKKVVIETSKSEAAGRRSSGIKSETPPIDLGDLYTIEIRATDFSNWFFGTFGGGKVHPPLEN